ncbi:hypothetical protein Y1Q_0017954 [Alligator mississippiensis]|uniref:Uncharacterized protein n=1 Tax=Alligator mississippiensis TaxID=8496 RepID=A0A151MXS9_ALLMI|nr:hypothetical protein Y1Q_0017954 [Alligator mississippiensis]
MTIPRGIQDSHLNFSHGVFFRCGFAPAGLPVFNCIPPARKLFLLRFTRYWAGSLRIWTLQEWTIKVEKVLSNYFLLIGFHGSKAILFFTVSFGMPSTDPLLNSGRLEMTLLIKDVISIRLQPWFSPHVI